MLPYQERVIEEKTQLDEKLRKIRAFMVSPEFGRLSPEEQGRIKHQENTMWEYSDVLRERIWYFGGSAERIAPFNE